MKLKTKILISTLSAVFTLFVLAMSINTYYFFKEAKEFKSNEIDSSISFFISEIDKLNQTAEKLTIDLAKTGEYFFEIKPQSFFGFKEVLSSYMTDKVNNYPEVLGGGIWYEPNLVGEKFFGPYAAWKNKKVEVTWEYSNEKYNYFNQSWYKLAIPETWDRSKPRNEQIFRTAPFIDNLNGEQTVFVTISSIMNSKDKKIIGISTVDLGLHSLKNLLSKFNATPNSFLILVDKISGKIIYHKKEEFLLKDYKELAFLNTISLNKLNEKETIQSEITIDKEKYILYSSATKSTFVLFTLVNKKEAYSVVFYIVIRNFLLTIITLILLGILLYILLARSIKPLDEIIYLLRGISSGTKTMNDRIQIKSNDEFGELAKTYNQMAFTIQKQNLEIKEHNERLEEKVITRTSQLNKTLEEVTALKLQQDGDYFLTSLLLEPLGKNRVNVSNIHLDFEVKQKKKFTFKKHSKEIGGDICTAHTIELEGKSYTVFLNADAMGKSMQGAGGALILGSVFNAIIERTQSSSAIQSLSPERWMKNTFIELHKTFETFDGSMLVSMILGLLDNATGYLYFINAEHPLAVLYRDNKANFLETKVFYRKLGVMETTSGIFIDTIQLQKDDIIILGSDGRDDILLSDSKIMNEDENRFLGIIEISEGNINKIFQNLESVGEITDDLSILRLEYKRNLYNEKVLQNKEKELILKSRELQFKYEYEKAILLLDEAEKINPKHPEILREKLRIYLLTKSFVKITEIAEEYLKIKPDDEEVIHICSYSYKRLKKLSRAFVMAEKLWLRKTTNLDYLTNYSEICENLNLLEKKAQALTKIEEQKTK